MGGFENRKSRKPWTGGVESVVHFITFNEQSQSDQECSLHSSFTFLLPGDHLVRTYSCLL